MNATNTLDDAVLRQLEDITALTEAELPAAIPLAVRAQTAPRAAARQEALAALYTSAVAEHRDYLAELVDQALRDLERAVPKRR